MKLTSSLRRMDNFQSRQIIERSVELIVQALLFCFELRPLILCSGFDCRSTFAREANTGAGRGSVVQRLAIELSENSCQEVSE